MNSPEPRPQHVVGLKSYATPTVITVPQHPLDSAANDAAATERKLNLFQNPLWIMTISLAVFCAVTASVIALG
jgi:hypothetical protein